MKGFISYSWNSCCYCIFFVSSKYKKVHVVIVMITNCYTSSYGGTHLRSRLRMQQVVSAEKGLTAVFGMGTGISLSRISTTIDTRINKYCN